MATYICAAAGSRGMTRIEAKSEAEAKKKFKQQTGETAVTAKKHPLEP